MLALAATIFGLNALITVPAVRQDEAQCQFSLRLQL